MIVKRIAFVVPSLGAGGAERVIATLANELIKSHSISVISFAKEEPYYALDKDISIYHCLDQLDPSKNIYDAISQNTKILKELVKIIKINKIEIVLSFLTSANVMSVLASKYCNAKTIISIRNNPEMDGITRFWSILRRLTYPLADHVTVQTEKIKSTISTYVNQTKITVIPNPLNPELANTRSETAKRDKIILSVGRLTDQKNHRMLIEAFHKTGITDWELIIVGEGVKRREYETLIKDLNIQELVKLPGKKKEINNFYNKASIFAFSSNYEGFPNALLEAMHFGLACISTDCPTGPSELINNNINGLLVEVENKEAMASGLLRLVQNENLRNKFGESAMITAKEYEQSIVVKKWMALID